jgi:hypothetical protein
MADRSLTFFMTPSEAELLLADLVGDLLVVDPGPDTPGRFVYLGSPGVSDGDPDEIIANPGAHAWVRFHVPRLRERVLEMAGLDIRTQWLTHDRPQGVHVFRRISRYFRPSLQRPVWAWNVNGGESSTYRDVAYTAEAAALFAAGYEWMQEGVANVRYGPTPPS